MTDPFPNRPMRCWELLSGFREFADIVRLVASTEQWRDPYLALFDRRHDLVAKQRREILDAPVPHEFTREVCRRVPLNFVLSASGDTLRRAQSLVTGSPLSALEVHERFGPAVIEEVLEYGSAAVAPVA
jgi:hypothetical protein